MTPHEFLAKWRQPGIAAPIASASKPEQLDVQFEALTLELSEYQLERLTAAEV